MDAGLSALAALWSHDEGDVQDNWGAAVTRSSTRYSGQGSAQVDYSEEVSTGEAQVHDESRPETVHDNAKTFILDKPRLAQLQEGDLRLEPTRDMSLRKDQSEKTSQEQEAYVLHDCDLLRHVFPRAPAELSAPSSLVPVLLTLVHITCGHAGVMRTTALVRARYEWSGLFADTRKHVLICGYRRRKCTDSHDIAMRPAQFLLP